MINPNGFARRNNIRSGISLFGPSGLAKPHPSPSPWSSSASLISPLPLPTHLNGIFISHSNAHRTHIDQILHVNLTFTRDKVLKYLTYLVGKGRLLRIKQDHPAGGYEVNQDWVAAQLEQQEQNGGGEQKKRKVLFTVKDWDLGPTALVPGGQNMVLRNEKFYFYLAKDEGKGGRSVDHNSKTRLDFSLMHDWSSKKSLGYPMTSRNAISSQQHSLGVSPSSKLPSDTKSFQPPKAGLTILLDAQNTPMSMTTLLAVNPHLSAYEIGSRLKERAEAGHMERFDIDVYRWNLDWLRKTLATDEGKKNIGYAFDERPLRKQSDYQRGMVNVSEIAMDGWQNTRQKEFVILSKLEEEQDSWWA
ncbi:hypothetical protein BKA64DRAFT_759895 [Cadophora sp. MPI-SDFR-AT-0126]|nr:hypothetical protein BKA64DRAFT_759895 [Leotiomycetes sp. MPI-SDFR-AT-0126]